jgi:hypothetical protein
VLFDLQHKRLAATSWSAAPQVIIMFFLGGIFKIERLSGLEWLVSLLIGVGSLPVCLLTKMVAK